MAPRVLLCWWRGRVPAQSRSIGWVVVAVLSLMGRPAHAADGGRPRVGLVLSGGGALGLAHVGVIEWLEAHRIPVDTIAGTSMGGLIGGSYATGMPTADMRRMLRSVRWEEAFRRDPPYRELTFRRKEDAIAFPGGFLLGWRHGLKWPRGLISAHPVGLVLSRISLPHATGDSFDALPIPFRAVAADLESGEEVVLGEGSLVLALRATMAFPGVFTPVEREGRLLADGGMLNNLPADVAQRMGAERIVAVYVGGDLGGRGSLNSPLDILNQSVSIITRQSVRRNRELADVYLAPDLEGFTASDYDRADALADAGYRSAEAASARLQGLALGEAEWQAYLAARQARRHAPEFVPAFVQVVGTHARQAGGISRSLRHHVGRPLWPAALEADLTGITGCGRFEGLTYERMRLDGREGILVRVQEKPYGPPFACALLEIDATRADDVHFNLPARVTAFGLGCAGGEVRADLSLGSRTLVSGEYYRPVGGNGWFAAPRIFTDRLRTTYSPVPGQAAEYAIRQVGVALDVGRHPDRDTELRAGILLSHLRASVRIGDPSLPSLAGSDYSVRASWVTDKQDSAVLPTRGLRFSSNARWHFRSPGTRNGFVQATADASFFRPLSPRVSLFAFATAGATVGGDPPFVHQLALSGPLRLASCARIEPRGSHKALAGVGYVRQVSQLPPPVGGSVHFVAWYQHGGVFSSAQTGRSSACLSGGFLAETLAGPLFLGAAWRGGSDGRLYFALGRFFKASGF